VDPTNVTYRVVTWPAEAGGILVGQWDDASAPGYLPSHAGFGDFDPGSLLFPATFTQAEVNAGQVFYWQQYDIGSGQNWGDQLPLVLSASDSVGDAVSNIVVPVVLEPWGFLTGGVFSSSGISTPDVTDEIGQSVTIGADSLRLISPQYDDSQITYAVWYLPQNGSLLLDNLSLTVGGTFTQADVDQGRLSYLQSGPAVASDTFGLKVGNPTQQVIFVLPVTITMTGTNGGAVLSDSSETQVLYSGPGDNWIIGRDGTTALSYANAPAGVMVDLATGTASNGFGGIDTISGINSVIGSAFDDTLIGGFEDDTLFGGNGHNAIVGGGGTNTAVYEGKQADYAVAYKSGALTVSGPSNLDALSNIQVLQFAGTTLTTLDSNGTTAVAQFDDTTGTGRVLIQSGTTVAAGVGSAFAPSGLVLGGQTGHEGDATVTGNGALLSNIGQFVIGDIGPGRLSIQNGGTVTTAPALSQTGAAAEIAARAGSAGSNVTVGGADAHWQVSGPLNVGEAAAGSLVITVGGTVTAGEVNVGTAIGATGAISVGGATARLDVGTNDIRIGTNSGDPSSSGNGSLSIFHGGVVHAGAVTLGDTGTASAAISIGGIAAQSLDLGARAGAQGSLYLTGAATGVGINTLIDGDGGVGRLVVANGANLVVHGTATVGNLAGSDGHVAVAAGGHLVANTLIDGNAGTANISVVGGVLGVTQGLTLGATGGLYLQAAAVSAGSIANRAHIAGSGQINAASFVNNGLVTAAGGRLTLTGNVTGNGALAVGGAGAPLEVNGVGSGQSIAFTAPSTGLQVDNLAVFTPSAIAGYGPSDSIHVVTDAASAAANSIAHSFDAVSDTLTITVGATTQALHMIGGHGAADFANVVGVDVITASHQTVDLGTGSHMAFLGVSAVHDTLVAPAPGGSNFLDIVNFNGTDLLDFRSALAGTTWNHNSASIGNYLRLSGSGGGEVIAISHDGIAAGTPIARLENSRLSFPQLLSHTLA